ncbi:MAG: glyoxalase [Solirubrobacterales bacterium]|jgi:predicted enzyme related to lactoylglutathione lyase|nr:glyoxalase [Solirubrobacterales bacterium]
MAGEPYWFEIGVADATTARSFYGGLLGWEFETGPSGEAAGAVIRTPGIDGGLHGGDPGASPYLFFRVDDMDAALTRVAELGGTVEPGPGVDPDQDSEFGCFALCRDDQDSPFGLHQPPAGG